MNSLNNFSNGDDTVKIYGFGVSFIEAAALSITFYRLLDETFALYYEDPIDYSEYFTFVYYLDCSACIRGYKIFTNFFAVMTPTIFENLIDINYLSGILMANNMNDRDDSDDDEEDDCHRRH